jgi:hypothetical protein
VELLEWTWTHIDARLLQGRRCVGINMAYLLDHWRGDLVVKDVRVIEKIRKDERWIAWNALEGNRTLFATQSEQQVYDGMESINVKIGDSTAISAIDWAVRDGATDLTLVGFDAGFRDGARHFHGEYPEEWNQAESKYLKHYDEIVEYTKGLEGVMTHKRWKSIMPGILVDYSINESGAWASNAAQKARVIRTALDDFWPEPVVWVDADARIKAFPTLLETLLWQDIDIAYHRRKSTHRRYDGELLTGTLYFGNTVEARLILDLWIKAIEENPGTWDQKLLDGVLGGVNVQSMRAYTGHPKEYDLPASYCAFDLVCQYDGLEESEAIIWHEQASRKLRKVVDGGA